MLFIFLWLIVSQLATKLSYRRRLDKVINMMVMRVNMMTMRTNLMTTMINMMAMIINMITIKPYTHKINMHSLAERKKNSRSI